MAYFIHVLIENVEKTHRVNAYSNTHDFILHTTESYPRVYAPIKIAMCTVFSVFRYGDEKLRRRADILFKS